MYIKGTEGEVTPTVSCISIPMYGGLSGQLAQQDATTLGFSLYGGFPGSKIQLVNEMLTFIPTSGINPAVTPVASGISGLASPTPTPTPTPTLSPSASMELVWHGEFDRLFSQYFPHIWCLVPTFQPPTEEWRTFKDSAKVRFSCQCPLTVEHILVECVDFLLGSQKYFDVNCLKKLYEDVPPEKILDFECGHGWTSMKGRVVFWFDLNIATNYGAVMFKLYGQQCQKCKNGKFEHAMWYPEEVVKVIGNVYNRVGQIYYGFYRPPLRIDRRSGKPRNQHNSELCQACKDGLCREEWSFA